MKYKFFLFLFVFCFCFGFGMVFAYRILTDTRLPEQKVVELKSQGRMGNLMFQYAGAYVYAQEHHKKLVVSGDLSELERAFGLKVNYTKDNPLAYSHLTEPQQAMAKLNIGQFDFYDPSFNQNERYGLLRGFFQDPKFFEKHAKEIRHLFCFKEELTGENKKLADQIRNTNSVSVHIRRGDYVEKKTYHLLLPETYYMQASDYIAERIPNPHFYIFSDDIEWVKKNIHLKYPHTFIVNNQKKDSYNDMRLMSACQHNITANSTFSWWGAWLNLNSNKIIVTPQSWLNDDKDWEKHALPKEWVKIQNGN